MNVRTVLIVALALVFGLSSAVMVHLSLSGSVPHVSNVTMTKVVVIETSIPLRTKVTPDMLKLKDWPANAVPPGAVTDLSAVKDRISINKIHKGEVLLEMDLSAPGERVGLGPILSVGMRAYAVRVMDPAVVLDGLLLPGSKVDVHLHMNSRRLSADREEEAVSLILLENVEVLAVGQMIEAPRENTIDARKLRSVTLQVKPRHASKLQLAENLGKLHLSLRSQGDHTLAAVDPVMESEIRLKAPETDLEPGAGRTDEFPPPPRVQQVDLFELRG
ncbi:MAG: Flp pilus assembly protein CpaB, partial [Planctomycetales bacterium]